MGRLAGKRCLVTGGSRNLGRAICLALAREGARVGFTFHRSTEQAAETRRLLVAAGVEPVVTQGSVTDAAHAEAAVAAALAAWGGLDVLVNNAAITQVLPFVLVDEADWDQVMDVNVKGAYLFARAALRPMIKQRGGRIVNVGAFGHGRVIAAPVHYAASKAALAGFTAALAHGVARYEILVNMIEPGILEAGLGRSAPESRLSEYLEQNPAGRFGAFDEVARALVWLVSDESSFVTGAVVPIDGGI